jgi:hypothetical protein
MSIQGSPEPSAWGYKFYSPATKFLHLVLTLHTSITLSF